MDVVVEGAAALHTTPPRVSPQQPHSLGGSYGNGSISSDHGGSAEASTAVAAARDWRRLAMSLSAKGDRAGVLSMYARVRACILQVNLSVEPSSDLVLEGCVLAAEACVVAVVLVLILVLVVCLVRCFLFCLCFFFYPLSLPLPTTRTPHQLTASATGNVQVRPERRDLRGVGRS